MIVSTPMNGSTRLDKPEPGLETRIAGDPALAAALEAVRARWPNAAPVALSHHGRHSNERVEVRYQDGRTLIVKRGLAPWHRQSFAASRTASELLRSRTEVIAPEQIPVPDLPDGPAMEVYWKVEMGTLAERWSLLNETDQVWALRQWGRILRRVHQVRLPGYGSLPRAEHEYGSLEAHLSADLEERLRPAVRDTWPEASGVMDVLVDAAAAVAGRAPFPVLLHGDPHYANILWEGTGRGIRGAGVLDLEAAWAGPPEADIAVAEVLHGPLFGQPLAAGWTAEFRRGYGTPLDPAALAFYRAVHLVNLGYHAALTGMGAHATHVLAAAKEAAAQVRACLQEPRATDESDG